MKKKLLSLVSCALIACNIFSTISYAEEAIDSSIEVTEAVSEETEMTKVDTTVEVEEPQTEENNIEIIKTEESAQEDADVEAEEKDSTEETVVDDTEEVAVEEEDKKETYTVSFVDSVDDAVFAEYVVDAGETVADLPEAPAHEGYDFIEYDGNYTDVICDEEVIAVYEPIADEDNLVFKELELDVAGYLITVAGNMPKNTELYVKQIESAEAEETIKTELDIAFEAQVSFDIKLISDGEQYQPTEFDETVSVSIKGLNTTEELEVYRITDDGAVTDMSASNIDETVKFDTDHFTTYTVGTAEYQAMSEGTFFGLKYEYFDTDLDGKEDLVVVTGTQTTPTNLTCSSPEEVEVYKKKYEKRYADGMVYVSSEGNNSVSFSDTRNTRNAFPWIKEGITKCHFKDVKLLNASNLFSRCENLQEIVLDNVDTTECINMESMFWGCKNLTDLKITSPLNTDNVRDMDHMFAFCTSLKTLDGIHNFDGSQGLFTGTPKVKTFERMFWGSCNLESIDLSSINGDSAETMEDMFNMSRDGYYAESSSVQTIILPVDLTLASNVKSMFSNCYKLQGGLDTTDWDTSKVQTMEEMFYKCFALENLDVSNWNVSNVTSFSKTFCRCDSIKELNVTSWDVSKAETMEELFTSCAKVSELDVSNWNVSNVTNMEFMFMACMSLEYLDLSNWNVSNVVKLGYSGGSQFFDSCDKLKTIDMFNTSLLKDGVDIPAVPGPSDGEHYFDYRNHPPMYIDDNKDGKPDNVYVPCRIFKKDNVSHRYIVGENIEYPENTLAYINKHYTVVSLYEPSDSSDAIDAFGPEFGTYIVHERYLVNNFEIIDEEVIDVNDPLNKTGRAYLYTIRMDNDEFKVFSGDKSDHYGPDNTYGTDDDYTYWGNKPIRFVLYQPDNPMSKLYVDEYYDYYKDFYKYSTGEKLTLLKDEWDASIINHKELEFSGLRYRIASFKLILKDEHGKKLFSDYVMYGEPITDILNQYGVDWLDADGNVYEPDTMPLENLTLSLAHKHVNDESVIEKKVKATCTADGSYDEVVYCKDCHGELSRTKVIIPATGHMPREAVVEENRVEPTHTTSGHYDSVIYCKDCGAELNREEIEIQATTHNPGAAVEENKIKPTCTTSGHYDSVVYCEDDGAELTRTRIEIEPLGHVHGAAVKENVVDATEDAEGSYEEVVYCAHCHEELSRETKSIARIEKNIPEIPSNDNNDDSGKTKPENKTSDSGNSDSGDSSQHSDTDKVEPENTAVDEVEEPAEEKNEDIVDVVDNGNNSHITVSSSNVGSDNTGEESLEYKNVDIVALNDSNELHEVDLSSGNDVNDNVSPKQAFIEKVVKAVVVTVGTTGATGGAFFVFIWFRRRKIKGKLVSRENLSYSNCLIMLEGKDKLRTRTNKKGEFTFRNLKKGTYILNVFNESEELLFQGEISMEKDGNLKTIINNGFGEHFEKVGETYFIDILA